MTIPALLPLLDAALVRASIPSPAEGVWYLGPVPLRGYALCIILGVVASIWVGERRWIARGGRKGEVTDLAVWAIPFGLVGGRLYHVATDYQLYFGPGQEPLTALYVWRGGLGIWGAVALGTLGVYLGGRRAGMRFRPLADALAPVLLIGQAIGRFGNWFNQELYGGPTDLPWALEIDPAFRPLDFARFETFHPTFLYEALWNLAVFGLLVWADRRFRLGGGRVFALYVAGYTAGRVWIENLRIDDVQMADVFGLRLNVWTSIVLFVLAIVFFVVSARRYPGREEVVYREGRGPGDHANDEANDEATDDANDDAPADVPERGRAEDGADGADRDEVADESPETGSRPRER